MPTDPSSSIKEPVTQASEEAKAVVELWENAYNNCPHYPGSGTRACECKVCLEEMISHALDRVSRQALERAEKDERERCAQIVRDFVQGDNAISKAILGHDMETCPVTATRCLRHATIPPTITPPETQECGVCMRGDGLRRCVCGAPAMLGVVHRTDGPCWIPAQDQMPDPGPGLSDGESVASAEKEE